MSGSLELPPGVLGEIANFIFGYQRYQEHSLALAGAISIYSGFIGKAFNAPGGAGLNTYTLFLAPTGAGKAIVKEARGRLFAEVRKSVPLVEDFKGPGELGSAAGGIRWLEKRPCCLSVFGEFGPMLKKITSPRANANDEGVQRFILDAYSESGAGSSIDPIAYSDRDKNSATIYGASYSIFAESVPERIYESLNEGLIASGLLPRFDVWESNGPRKYINRNRVTTPPVGLVNKLADIAAHCLAEAEYNKVTVPTYGPGAEERLFEFEAWTTDRINASDEIARQLWNRAFLKALKLASIRAIGINHIAPVITLADVDWAGNLVAAQTLNLLSKFATGDVGNVEGDENKQLKEVRRVVGDYIHSEYAKNDKYGGSFEMHRDKVITEAHIQRRLITLKAFKPKPKQAIKDTLKALLDADELREVPKAQMQMNYGCSPRAFVATNPACFPKSPV
ncbi:hypothetical protein [Sphingomonas melonis]|uniref:hypothetical protein n=1 Tax=Sphingomonas melonis TaxID=152682 RepID=UPI0035C82D83